MLISELVEESFETADAKGWWPNGATEDVLPGKIALMHSELSEALEEYRDNHAIGRVYFGDNEKPEGVLAEFADVFIRIADTVGAFGVGAEFEEVLRQKLAYNKTRSHRHDNKRC